MILGVVEALQLIEKKKERKKANIQHPFSLFFQKGSTITRAVDRIIFLHEGKVVWQGNQDEFMNTKEAIVRQFASGSLEGPISYV